MKGLQFSMEGIRKEYPSNLRQTEARDVQFNAAGGRGERDRSWEHAMIVFRGYFKNIEDSGTFVRLLQPRSAVVPLKY